MMFRYNAPMKLLAIETATEACSAALWLDGELLTRHQLAPRRHAELILPMMDQLLAEAGVGLNRLDALAFGRGPGSFTGVRIATGVIQGAALGVDLPVVPVSTLATLAQGAFRIHGERRVLAAFDARMGELYWGAFQAGQDGLVEVQQHECVAGVDTLPLPRGEGWFGAGSGWEAYGSALSQRLGPALRGVDSKLLCDAEDLARLAVTAFERGDGVAADQALPVYLRDQVAKKSRA